MKKYGHECNSTDTRLTNANSPGECARNCKNQIGCRFFSWGYKDSELSDDKNRCYWEHTTSEKCFDGFEEDNYHFYQVNFEVKSRSTQGKSYFIYYLCFLDQFNAQKGNNTSYKTHFYTGKQYEFLGNEKICDTCTKVLNAYGM